MCPIAPATAPRTLLLDAPFTWPAANQKPGAYTRVSALSSHAGGRRRGSARCGDPPSRRCRVLAARLATEPGREFGGSGDPLRDRASIRTVPPPWTRIANQSQTPRSGPPKDPQPPPRRAGVVGLPQPKPPEAPHPSKTGAVGDLLAVRTARAAHNLTSPRAVPQAHRTPTATGSKLVRSNAGELLTHDTRTSGRPLRVDSLGFRTDLEICRLGGWPIRIGQVNRRASPADVG